MTLDSTSVYWTDYWAGTVSRAPLSGGPTTVVAAGQSGPLGIAVDEASIYWTNAGENAGNDGAVMKVAIGGGTPEQLAWFQNGARGIAVDGTGVWWGNHADGDNGRVLSLTPK